MRDRSNATGQPDETGRLDNESWRRDSTGDKETMAYAEVTVIVNGAMESTTEFDPDESNRTDPKISMDAFIAGVETAAKADRQPTEVYILVHDHEHECECGHTNAQHIDGGPAEQHGDSVFVPADPCGECACEGYEETECACAQYATDHHPSYAWNVSS